MVNNVVSYAGESAILLVGSTALMNGTRNTYPAYTNVTNNLCYEMGYYGKQTAAYFRSIAYKSTVTNNVFFNSPRSLVNYNDAFRGGDLLADNVMWGAVKETNDHASFNSWDRQSWFWGGAQGVVHVKPEMMEIQRNLILNKDYQFGSENSDWQVLTEMSTVNSQQWRVCSLLFCRGCLLFVVWCLVFGVWCSRQVRSTEGHVRWGDLRLQV